MTLCGTRHRGAVVPGRRGFLAVAGEARDGRQALTQAGASGFLLKDATREQLTGAVRTVAAGSANANSASCGW